MVFKRTDMLFKYINTAINVFIIALVRCYYNTDNINNEQSILDCC